MAPRKVNVLLSSFGGLGLPATSNIVCATDLSLRELRNKISDILPPLDARLTVTTTSNQEISNSEVRISSLIPSEHANFLYLRLSVPLRGGKGGFGSQLRAAGGRMASKRKRNQGENNSSNRNLDGRRLRTVNEAKALAEYLALKPEMEKKEREARRKRWQQVVDLAERREEEIRIGSKGKVDGKWVEDKEEAGERTREAVLAAMLSGDYRDNLKGSSMGVSAQTTEQTTLSSREDEKAAPRPRGAASASKPAVTSARFYAGFDEDDEFMSDSEEGDTANEEEIMSEGEGEVPT